MKKTCIILAAITALYFPVFAGTVVALVPPGQTVALDDLFPVTVAVTDVTDLYAYQFDLAFDPTHLRAISVDRGAILGTEGDFLWFAGSIDNTAGTISFVYDSLYTAITGISGDGTLATITFQGIAYGTGSVALENTILLDSSIAPITVGTVDASVTAAPEPGSALLLSGALFALCAFLRRCGPGGCPAR